MTDPSHDMPPSLVERLRNTASYLASGCLLPAKPNDGSDDPSDPVDDVTFEVEELRDLASLYATAADALEKKLGEVARLGARLADELSAQTDPPNRAPLLAQLEALLTSEPTNLGPIRNAIDAIRTDARVIEATRGQLKGWHSWARKLARAEGDEYANARPERLQGRIEESLATSRLGSMAEQAARADLPGPEGYTAWISMGNSGWARDGKRVADDVIDAWAHSWGLQPEAAANLRRLVVAAARRALGGEEAAKERDEFGGWLVTTFQPGHVDEAAVLMPRGEYESGAAFCRRVLQLALDRGAFSVGSGRIEGLRFEELPEAEGWRTWARTVIGCDDGTDAELQALIGRMLATANKLRRQNQLAFDALASGPLPMVAPSHPLDAQMATTADVAERARAAASNLRYAMGHPQESPDPTPAAMQDAAQVLTVAAAVLEAKPAATDPWTPTWETDCGVWPVFYADAPGFHGGVERLVLHAHADDFTLYRGTRTGSECVGMQSEPNWAKGSVVEYRSLAEVAAAYPMVSPTLDDYKAGRLVPFAQVRAEAFRLAGLTDPGDAPRG